MVAAPSVLPLLAPLLPTALSLTAHTYGLSTPMVLPKMCPVLDIIAPPPCRPQTRRPSVVYLSLGSSEQERSVHMQRSVPAAKPHAVLRIKTVKEKHRFLDIDPWADEYLP
jgi:hypothetical protein